METIHHLWTRRAKWPSSLLHKELNWLTYKCVNSRIIYNHITACNKYRVDDFFGVLSALSEGKLHKETHGCRQFPLHWQSRPVLAWMSSREELPRCLAIGLDHSFQGSPLHWVFNSRHIHAKISLSAKYGVSLLQNWLKIFILFCKTHKGISHRVSMPVLRTTQSPTYFPVIYSHTFH